MLLQVKASLSHGEWLPWLKQQQESGAIQVSQQTASKYMKLASNYNRERNLLEAPSIRAALELGYSGIPSRYSCPAHKPAR